MYIKLDPLKAVRISYELHTRLVHPASDVWSFRSRWQPGRSNFLGSIKYGTFTGGSNHKFR